MSLNAKKLMLFKKMFFRLILLFYIYAVLPACMYVYPIHAWCLRRSEDGVRSPALEFIHDHELPCGCWNLNLGPLQEQHSCLNLRATSPTPKLVLKSEPCFSVSLLPYCCEGKGYPLSCTPAVISPKSQSQANTYCNP